MILNKYDKEVAVAVDLDNLVLPVDPSNNVTLTNAFFSNNLYSNLIDIDEKNQYQLDLASKFWFEAEENKVVFEFENSRVTAEDAAFSLQRLLIQNTHQHADFWDIICAPQEFVEKCSKRIFVEDKKLVISFHDREKSSYILPILASVDYKIVPRDAFDTHDFRTAKVVNHKVTSGYYHMEILNGEIYFIKNSNVKSNIYSKWHLVNADMEKIKSADFLNKVNVLSTTVLIDENAKKNLSENNWNIFNTHNINVRIVVFNKNTLNRTTPEERFSIAFRIGEHWKEKQNASSIRETLELFQDFGQGNLDSNQKQVLNQKRLDAAKLISTPKVFFGLRYPEKWADFENRNHDILLKKVIKISDSMHNNASDVYTIATDVSFDLNISLIAYAVKTGILEMSKKELDNFSIIRSDDEKIKFINQIHYKTLEKCLIYPVFATPYTTAFNGDFEHNLSKFNSRTLLWKIH